MFAAIYIPDFPVEAIVRAEPPLREHAVAVIEGMPPLVHVVAVNEKAADAGVEPGMTKLQAEERLSARERSSEREAAAHAALLDCACGFSPRVEDTAADTVLLDVGGLERIFGPPAKLARDIARRCSELGLEANVAVASNADTAMLAARGFPGVTVIPPGKEAERLGELAVDVLCGARAPACAESQTGEGASATQSLELLDTLERWGVRNLRALAALPEVALSERLGQEGLRLQKLARGATPRPLVVAEPPLRFEEAMELEYPVDLLEPLSFLLNRMLEQLCARLAARALATNEIRLKFVLEITEACQIAELSNCGIEENDATNNSAIPQFGNSAVFTRTLRLPVPMLDAKVFLKLIQLDLQANPPQAPVTKIWVAAEPAEPRRAQDGLFVPAAPDPERLELTIARINKVVVPPDEKNCRFPGDSSRNQQSFSDNQKCISEPRVGSPEILDTHRRDAFRMQPFSGAGAVARSAKRVARVSEPGTRVEDPRHSVTALRVFRPPLVVTITLRDARPAHFACPDRPAWRGSIVWCAGPWRSSGEWWTEQVWSRAEWDIAVQNEEGVAVYRVFRDEIAGKWFVEGSYD
ncbi:MAG: DNA polymerase Y family protein [Terriglobales bacterium]